MLSFIFVWICLVFYSFTRVDLNLVLYKFIPDFFKNIGFYQRPLAALIFSILISLFVFFYFKLVAKIHHSQQWIKWFLLFTAIAIPAYPMFSSDIFNYLFNAKMALIFKANPHINVAIDFPDPMLRFMRNIHTPAPYAYGWTGISLVPGLAWFTKKFTLSFWVMKSFVAVFLLAQLWILKKLVNQLFPKQPFRWLLFAFSPLVLIETLIMGHNDVVMMFPALLGFWYLLKSKKLFDKPHLFSLTFLLLSASIKYATIALFPLFLFPQGSTLRKKKLDIPTFTSLALFAIMFTRPDQMHSWYFIWAFSFAILSRSKWLLAVFSSLSLGAVFRYLPFIYYGNWDSPVYLLSHLIWASSILFAPLIKKITDGNLRPRPWSQKPAC